MSNARDGNGPPENRMASRMGIMLSVILAVTAGMAAPASAYWGTKGYAGARATFVAWDESSYPSAERIFFNRSVSTVQTLPDYASSSDATHGASLPAGVIWVRTRAEHEALYGDADARASAVLFDFLYVDVPAGTYPAGVYLTVDGAFQGQIDLRGDSRTTADVHWQAVLEASSFEEDSVFGRIQLAASESLVVNAVRQETIDDPFSLTVELYPPGSTVVSGYVFPVRLYMSIGDPESISLGEIRSVSFEGDLTTTTPGGESKIDMLSTGSITSISVVGEGVTWESESGVLLPEPDTTLSLAIGGAALALVVRRRIRPHRD